MTSTPVRTATIKKKKKVTNAGEDVKEREPWSTVGGNVNCHVNCKRNRFWGSNRQHGGYNK